MSDDTQQTVLLHCVCCGVPFRVSTDAAQLGDVRNNLPHLTTIVDITPDDTMAFHMGPHTDLGQFRSDLMIHVAEFAPDFVFVHAGVVAWQGSVLLFPGRSFAGKTTLVAELVKAGATYYSDEYALVDEDGLVHPFTRRLQMRRPGSWAQRDMTLADLGVGPDVSPAAEPLRVSHVILTEFVPGSSWNPEAVSTGNAILGCLANTIPVQRAPGRAMRVLTKMMTGAKGLQSPRGDAAQTAQLLLHGAAEKLV